MVEGLALAEVGAVDFRFTVTVIEFVALHPLKSVTMTV